VALDDFVERVTLRSADLIVTVSEVLVQSLAARHRTNVALVRNGIPPKTAPNGGMHTDSFDSSLFNIVHTGNLYQGRRDTSLLFEVISSDRSTFSGIRLHFYGQDCEHARSLSVKYRMEDQVQFHGMVPRGLAVASQRRADALLLALGNDEMEAGIVTGKLFEYLAADRPILVTGFGGSEASKIVAETGRGTRVDSAETLRRTLVLWLQRHSAGQEIAHLPDLPDWVYREAQWNNLFHELDGLPK